MSVPKTPAVDRRGFSVESYAPWLALLAVYLIWGSTYAAIRVAVHVIPPFTMAGVRYLLAGLMLYPFARRGRPRASVRSWAVAALIGLLMLAGGNGLVSLGEQTVPSGATALLFATVSLWLVVLERVFLRVRIRLGAVAGLLGGLVGVAILVGRPGASGVPIDGGLVVLVASALWAGGSLVARTCSLGVGATFGTACELLSGGVVSFLIGGVRGEWDNVHLDSVNLHVGFAFVWLVVAGSLVAFSAYLYALRTLPIAIVGTFAYVNPVVAVAIGSLLLGEHIRLTALVAGVIIVGSVTITIRDQARPGRRED